MAYGTDRKVDLALEERLTAADPALGRWVALITKTAGPQRVAAPGRSKFAALARSVISQQLSVKAAATIHGRFEAALGGDVTPERAMAIAEDKLLAAGLSRGKAKYIGNLAAWFHASGPLLDDPGLSDEAIIAMLTQIGGIGVWTVHMFLMFHMRRPDVLPIGDLGIRKGVQAIYGLKNIAAPNFVTRKAASWKPFRSTACLYLWRGFDLGIHKEFRANE